MTRLKNFEDYSVDYANYVAEEIEKLNGRHTCGSIAVPTNHSSCNIVNDPASKFVGNSRIDGSSCYSNNNEMLNIPNTAATAVINNGTFKDGVFDNGNQWHPGTWYPEKKNTDDNIGWWTKDKNKELTTFEKWSIGIGIASLIVGIITALVMFF